jgi:sucrose phosphorylase
VVESILFYIRKGADLLRLDAVTYLWDEPGTEGIHLPQTHEIIRLLRDVVDAVGSGVALITETNVPHSANISYFGNGNDEAHMVYNFALPPLVLHAFYSGKADYLSRWAESIEPPSDTAGFLNILDTHDGIGLMGVKEILPAAEISFIIETALKRGGYISWKTGIEGVNEPYEINTTWWSAINAEGSEEPLGLQVKRYVASRSIPLVLKGVPGIYIHGAMGTSNDHAAVTKSGVGRDVNRGTINARDVEEECRNFGSKTSLICSHMKRLHLIRSENRAFHPRGLQKVLNLSPCVFALLRISPEDSEQVLTITNVTEEEVSLDIPLDETGTNTRVWTDLIDGKKVNEKKGILKIVLSAFDVVWLRPDSLN